MRWHVAVQVGNTEPPLMVAAADRVLPVAIDAQGAPAPLSHNAWELLGRSQLPVSPPAAVDLFRMAAAVFAADLRVPRSADPHSDGWTRDFVLHVPVAERPRWEAARPTVEHLLRFLTGDVWRAEYSEAPFAMPPARLLRETQPPLDASAVCLLSGGLDSFIGASDALAGGERLYLVSVGSQGSAAQSTPAQDRVTEALRGRLSPSTGLSRRSRARRCVPCPR